MSKVLNPCRGAQDALPAVVCTVLRNKPAGTYQGNDVKKSLLAALLVGITGIIAMLGSAWASAGTVT